ncbi:MAG: 5-formyltetrahydrofolate cyclo-ligase [Halieaceae bacterium]|jgi:5-formyltetrahydrofolate cyclo-ligase|nr:5-formyltetrahydrofolate cyclo-ligase [Halieaceae bacterium]
MNNMSERVERWKGRHRGKDALRHDIWAQLENSGAAVTNPWSTIPNFVGAAEAARRLTSLPSWDAARVVKCNPDAAQAPLRLLALQAGKRVYTPVPELVADFPYLLLDPDELCSRGIAFEDVMYSDGAMRHGKRCSFADVEALDFFVVGCVAVTRGGGRTGKGAGFADLEMGLFRHYGCIRPTTPVVTTVHDIQIVADERVVMQAHDNPLDWIATPSELIATHTRHPTPGPINWQALQQDQFEDIPFLRALMNELQGA